MPLLLAVKATSFLMEGDLFFFGQGSSGMGTSRGKIHGIQVFGKFLLPLLFGGLLSKGFLRLVLPSTKNILLSLVFFMLVDCCLHPITKMGKPIDGFKIDHGSLESLGESLEELLADHGFVYVVFPHLDYVFEICHILVDITSFHFESEDVSSCEVFAHVILERFSEIINNGSPDPFISVSAPKCHMFGNQLTGVLYPCFDSGSTDVPQK